MKIYDGVIFDFDGTIADTGVGIFESIRYAIDKAGLEQISEESIRTFIGPPLFDSFSSQLNVDDKTAELLVQYYREHYSQKGIYKFNLYLGITQLIKDIKEYGVITAVGSSKPEHFIKKILEYKNLSPLFDYVTGSDPKYNESDKTTIVNTCLDKMNFQDKTKVLMVGDRKFDIIGAHNAGIACAAVLFGYGSKKEFEECNAEFIVEKASDIKNIVINY